MARWTGGRGGEGGREGGGEGGTDGQTDGLMKQDRFEGRGTVWKRN